MVPGIIPGMVGQTGPTLSYLNRTFSATSTNLYNFTSQPLGVPSPSRLIVVAASASLGASFNISSATINGVGATLVAFSYQVTGSANMALVFWQAVVPNDSSGTIQIVWSRSVARCAIGVWAIDGLLSTTSVSSMAGITGSGGGSANLSMNTQVGDIIIGGLTAFNNDSTSWSGLNEDFDAAFSFSQHSGASFVVTTAETPRTITATNGGSSASAAVLWR